ncbi:MAG TPA: hypothetical protein VD813_04185, partial [Pseudonocardia sp.]|nr:hypothetical protein [Pseudonocardia sp.]
MSGVESGDATRGGGDGPGDPPGETGAPDPERAATGSARFAAGEPGPVVAPLVPEVELASQSVGRRSPAPTAEELTEDAIVRHRGDRPRGGWRGAVYTLTGGRVNPGIGPEEQARQDRLRRIRAQLPGSHQIAVTS